MGIFDRLKKLGGSTTTFKRPEPEAPQITLRASEQQAWVAQVTAALDLQSTFHEFSEAVDNIREQATDALKPFTDEKMISALPERARTINELHGNEYATHVRKLLASAHFTDLFSFETEHAAYTEALNATKERTKRNTSALQEFFAKELKESQATLQKLEDTVISFLSVLEQHKYPLLVKMRTAATALQELDTRREKYAALQASLEADLQRVRAKTQKIEGKMREQRTLIRNDAALAALDKLGALETDLAALTNLYSSTCTDVLKYYAKHPELTFPAGTKSLLDELPKDTARILAERTQVVATAFAALAEQLEQEGRGSVGNLVSRLRALAERAVQDAGRVSTILPAQRQFKKEILRDVAALSVYDQQQFLLRAQQEEREIQTKLKFLDGELDPGRRITLERELKDSAISMGAFIEGEPLPAAVDAELASASEELVDEVAQAEQTQQKAQKVISKGKA